MLLQNKRKGRCAHRINKKIYRKRILMKKHLKRIQIKRTIHFSQYKTNKQLRDPNYSSTNL